MILRLGWLAAVVVVVLAAGCARPAPPAGPSVSAPAPRGEQVFEPEGAAPGVPTTAHVRGVPFVSWTEAARLWFRERDQANPSSHAAFLMVLGYWGQHWAMTEDRESMRRWGVSEARRAASLDELKPLVAAGIPIIVATALTPLAHPVSAGLAVRVAGSADFAAGTLGAMVPLAALQPLAAGERWETLFAAFRVVIGYDDVTRTVLLHDPVFGPARTERIADFERMWALTDRAVIVMRPYEPAPIVAAHAGAPPDRLPTPDEEAAHAIAAAQALRAVGRLPESRQRVSAALGLAGLGAGAEHLLRLQRAADDLEQGDVFAARQDAERAASLVPEHARAWTLLATIYRRAGRLEDAEAAQRRADTVGECADGLASSGGDTRVLPAEGYTSAQRHVAERLALGFFVTTACAGSDATWLLRPLR